MAIVRTADPAAQEPHYVGHRQRLRERFELSAFDGFAPHEVIELILTLAIPRMDTKPHAKALLARFGSLKGVLDAPLDELRTVPGLGGVAPIGLRVIRETADLYLRQRAESEICLLEPAPLMDFWRARLGGLRHEVFEAAYLDSGYRLVRHGVERLEEGTIDRVAVYPRKILEAAIRRQAAAVIIAHNHPNRRPGPSEEDRLITRAIVLAAAALEIRIHDHLIVGGEDVFSFREAGLI